MFDAKKKKKKGFDLHACKTELGVGVLLNYRGQKRQKAQKPYAGPQRPPSRTKAMKHQSMVQTSLLKQLICESTPFTQL